MLFIKSKDSLPIGTITISWDFDEIFKNLLNPFAIKELSGLGPMTIPLFGAGQRMGGWTLKGLHLTGQSSAATAESCLGQSPSNEVLQIAPNIKEAKMML